MREQIAIGMDAEEKCIKDVLVGDPLPASDPIPTPSSQPVDMPSKALSLPNSPAVDIEVW